MLKELVILKISPIDIQALKIHRMYAAVREPSTKLIELANSSVLPLSDGLSNDTDWRVLDRNAETFDAFISQFKDETMADYSKFVITDGEAIVANLDAMISSGEKLIVNTKH